MIPSLPTTDIDLPENDDVAANASVEYTQHPSLWFMDGSVIIQAETTLFRVHMSQLSRHSLFFRDLFSLPQPPHLITHPPTDPLFPTSDQRFMFGCPVLEVQDTAEDFAYLLTALYDGPTFGTNDRDDYRVVSGLLRLATKYLIDKLRARALEHLSVAWPSTLRAWDAREEVARIFEIDTGLPRGLRYPSPIDVITLADEVSADSLLPAAFYDLSRHHFAQIFDPDAASPLRPLSPSTALSSAHLQRLALGKEAAQHAVTGLVQHMSAHAKPGHAHAALGDAGPRGHRRRASGAVCVSGAACRKDFDELGALATQHYLVDREKGCCDPLYVAEELGGLKSAEFSECKACARALEAWATRERDRLWKLIPAWFRLDAPR